jgi:DNA-directed RNA polymerase subunit H (RpoH/RPB5)
VHAEIPERHRQVITGEDVYALLAKVNLRTMLMPKVCTTEVAVKTVNYDDFAH